MERSVFPSLPNELKYLILSFVPLLQLTEFTCTSRCARDVCSNSLNPRLLWLDNAGKTTKPISLQLYLEAFRKDVDPETRVAIKATLGYVWCPDDYRDIDERARVYYKTAASAIISARQGHCLALNEFAEAEEAAQEAGLLQPDFSGIEEIYWKAAAPRLKREAREDAGRGHCLTLYELTKAEEAAHKAGLPPPDSSDIRQTYWAAVAPRLETEARKDAGKGIYWALSELTKAEEAAQKANLPPPDSSGIEDIYWKAAAPRLEEEAREGARNGLPWALYELTTAEEAAQKAGLPPPDSSGIRRIYWAAAAPIFEGQNESLPQPGSSGIKQMD